MPSILEFHALAGLFPLLEGGDFDELVASVKASGLREAIVMFEEKILDGRNRYRACQQAGAIPKFTDFVGSDPLTFVIDLNLKRRHLSESQRSMVADKLANMKQGARTDLAQICAMSQDQAASLLNVSRRGVQSAAKVRDQGVSDLVHAVERGSLKVSAAAAIASEPEDFQQAFVAKLNSGAKSTEALRQTRKEFLPEKVKSLPVGVFRVIYADPPWAYNDARRTGDHRESTGAINHYADVGIDELCAMKIGQLAAPDAVLLLWGTFPLLPDAITLIKAWGFTYKTSFVWDKGHGSFGNYHDADAELLLVATCGSCLPEPNTKVKQIQHWPRAKHSAKPEEARQMIDTLWPSGPRIELFRRGSKVEGWEAWGAESE